MPTTLKTGAFWIIPTFFLHLNSLTGIRIIFSLFQDVDFILFLLTVLIILCLNILQILRITLSTDYTVTLALLNTFLKWEENGCDCDAGEIARTLEELYS